MSNYGLRSYGRRKKSQKWIFIAILVASVFVVKKYAYVSSPASVFGGAEEIALPIPEVELEQMPAAVEAERIAPEPKRVASDPVFHKMAEAAPESSRGLSETIDSAIALIDDKSGRLIEARDRLCAALSQPISDARRAFVKEEMSKLSGKWLFGPEVFAGDKLCGYYKVEPGDMLALLAKKFKVPYEILMEINNIRDARSLQAGQTIKIINGPFHCRVYRSTYTMDVFLQDTYVMSFPVGLGKQGMETPTGTWVVKAGGKMISPLWTDPETGRTYQPQDRDYPLGARWIALHGVEGAAKGRDGFAIHGSPSKQASSGAVSRGCIRLYSGNEILLYNLLVPEFSQVTVVD